MQQTLKYGQIIRIHLSENKINGVIIAKGFLDPYAYLMQTDDVNQINNFRDTLFVILPRGTFELHDEYLKKRKEQIEDSLESRKQTEAAQYHIIIQSRMNEDILLGAEVVFKHVDSQQYLYGSYECSDLAMDAFKLKLSSHLSSQAIFKLSIYHTYQKDGQLIYLDEPITIMHEKSKCKLDYEEGQIFLDSLDSNKDYQINPEKYTPKIKKPLNERKEAVISLNSQTQWKFQSLENNNNIFQPHDLCFFISTQSRGYLSYEATKLTLKEYKDNEYIPLNAVWELEQIENKFVIRNILNGNVINSKAEVIDYNQQNNNQQFLIEPAKFGNIELLQFNSLVKIRFEHLELEKQMKGTQQYMRRLSSITPQIDNYYQQLSIDDLEYIQYNVQFSSEKSMHGFQIKKLKDKFKQDLLFIISSHELLQQFCDYLRFGNQIIEEKLNDKILTQVLKVLKKLIAYLLNCQHYQIDSCQNLPIPQRQYFMKDLMIVELTMQIIYYLWKIDSKNLFNQRKYERDKLGQIYLYSYRLIEKMSKKNQIVKLYISQWLRFLLIQVIEIHDEQISKSIFELLDDNYYSITKFINKEALQKLVNDISATEQLKEIYLRIFSSIIICKGKPIVDNQTAILELIQNTQNNYENNSKLQQQEFKQPGLFYKIQMKLDENKNKAYLQWKNNQWLTLKEFYLESQRENNLQTWNYFLAYINLLSDICANRYSFGQEYVATNYKLPILCNILEDKETLEINAIDPFLKLIHEAFIDCKQFSPIRRIARVREWAQIEKKTDIIKTKTPPCNNLTKVMEFICKFINFEDVIQQQTMNYETLYTVLQVLKTTIRLGFWQSISQLQDLFKPLFQIVQFVQDQKEIIFDNLANHSSQFFFTNQKLYLQQQQQQQQQFQQQNFVLQCKQLACEIIDIIIDMETNVRVSLSTAFLKTKIKEYMEQQKQGAEYNINMKNTILEEQEIKQKFVQKIEDWRNNFLSLIEVRDLFKKDQELSNQKLQKIIELIYFDNQILQNYSIKLLSRVYGQRKELIENFEKTIIEHAGFMHYLCQKSRDTRNKLLRFNDKNILLASLDSQNLYNVIFWGEGSLDQKQITNNQDQKQPQFGVIQDLYWLVECLKQGDGVEREKINYHDICPENKLQQAYTEKEKNFKLYQSLIKYQDLHENILEFLELAIEITKQEQDNKNKLIMKTLYACFRFLTMLIWNHQENKKDFTKVLDSIYPYIQLNVFCIQFIRELFLNNKSLLFNESKCQKIVMEVVEQCERIPFSNYYKSQLLDFLRVLTIYNQKSIKSNQNIIMAALQNRKFSKIMILFTSEREELSIFNELTLFLTQYHEQYKQLFSQIDHDNEQYIVLSPELTYIFNYYQLLTMLIADRNEINIGKCSQMHPYSKLIIQYQKLGQCWPLKRHLRAYINRLYYKHTKQFIGITQKIIEVDLENILQDLKDIVELKESELAFQKIKIRNPTRFSYLCSYYYLTLEENLISLNLIFEQNSFFDDLEDTLRENIQKKNYKLHFDLLQLGTLLKKVKNNWSTSEFLVQFVNNLMIILCTIYKTFNLQTIIVREINRFSDVVVRKSVGSKVYYNGKITERPNEYKDHKVELIKHVQIQIEDLANKANTTNIEELKDSLIDKLYDLSSMKKQIKDNQIFKKSKKKKKNKFSLPTQENEELNLSHRLLMRELNKSHQITKFLDEEFFNFCDQLMGLNQKRLSFDFGQDQRFISLQGILQNIIELNLNHYDILNEDLKIFILRILERVITSQVPQEQLNCDNERQKTIEEWEPDDWSSFKEKIEQQQLFLLNCGAAELICKYLQIPNLEQRLSLTTQLISFGIAFLLGGNENCQNAILEKLQNDNLNQILINYRQLIIRVSKAVYNNFKFRKNRQFGNVYFQVNLHDNYDYYDDKKCIMKRKYVIEEDDDKEIRIKEQFITLFIRSFRFLQLLCENNNKNMKNFIRQQIDSDTSMKIGSINFIELATSQLRIFLKTFNKNILQVPIFILEFILEVVQVPCLDNQLTLCKTTFFEDVCYFIQQMSNENMIYQRQLNEDQCRDMLYQIYNKIMIIIISVLEGNDDRILHDLQKKIDPKMLIQVIKEFLKSPKLQVEDVQQMELKLNSNKDFQYIKEIKQILNVIIIKEKIQFEKFNFENENENIKNIIELLSQKILKIEIVYQNKAQTIFFPSHPLFQFLSDETRDMIMYKINRETYREKILGLLEFKDLIHKELEYSYKLSKIASVPVTSKTIQTLRRLSAFFSILVNILMVLSYNLEIYNYQVQLIADYHEQFIINILSLSQLFTTIIYYIFYLRYRIPLFIQPYQNQEQIQQQEQNIQNNNNNEMDLQVIRNIGKRSYSITGIDEETLKNAQQQLLKKEQLYSKTGLFLLKQYRKSAKQLLKYRSYYEQVFQIFSYIVEQINNIRKLEENLLQTTFYLIFSLLGTFYKSYFFSLHLFDLFSRLTLLSNVFQAISHNASQLIVVSLLGVLFIFVFSFTSFDQYADDIYTEKQPEEHCETLISCMITLVTSGVIGTSMSKWDFVKFCYDTLYFVFFALLFTNIVSGIMIDTFAELRDQRQKIDDDKNNCCFICGAKRAELEKNCQQFDKHIKDKHFLWNYIYYIYCLNNTNFTEYTGLEYSIKDMIKAENISWFPMQLEDEQNQDQLEIDNKLTKIETQIQDQLNKINNLIQHKLEKDLPQKIDHINLLLTQMQQSYKSN